MVLYKLTKDGIHGTATAVSEETGRIIMAVLKGTAAAERPLQLSSYLVLTLVYVVHSLLCGLFPACAPGLAKSGDVGSPPSIGQECLFPPPSCMHSRDTQQAQDGPTSCVSLQGPALINAQMGQFSSSSPIKAAMFSCRVYRAWPMTNSPKEERE